MTKGEETRQRIIEQAAPVFNQRGFAGASMQDLLDATGLEKGGLYRHFPSKQALAAEAFRYAVARNSKIRTAHLDEIASPVAKLRAHIDHFVTKPSCIPGGCALLNTAIESVDTNPELRELAVEAMEGWRTRLMKIIQAGKRAGEFRANTNPRTLANTIISTLEGALMMSRLERTRDPMRDAQSSLDALLTLYSEA